MSSFLESEIRSQPEVVARLLAAEMGRIEGIVAHLPPFDYVLMAARGSSDHAALYAKYLWGELAGYPVAMAAPSLFTLYDRPPKLGGALVVGVSQSGQSPDIVAVLEEARRQNRPALAVTNDGSSPLARAADYVVELHAGPERSVAATKTYTAQLAVMAAFGAAWSGDRERAEALQRLPEALAATLAGAEPAAARAERYRYVESLVVVGRGYNYATAFELALKVKELTYVMAIPYSSADFRHGPIATVGVGSPVLLVMPRDATFDDVMALGGELEQREAELLVISDADEALSLARTPLPLAGTAPAWLSPITAVLPGQLFALRLALAKGIDPDAPRGLMKVTKTR